MVPEFNSNPIHGFNSPQQGGLAAAANLVAKHAAQTVAALNMNLFERHDPLGHAVRDGFAALDQARMNRANKVSAEGLGHSNPIVSEKDIA